MGRTQVYLTDEELELLERVERETGASRSELIRRAVRSVYGPQSVEEKLRLLRSARGVWKDRPFTGAQYVEAIRGDVNDRLRRLGFE